MGGWQLRVAGVSVDRGHILGAVQWGDFVRPRNLADLRVEASDMPVQWGLLRNVCAPVLQICTFGAYIIVRGLLHPVGWSCGNDFVFHHKYCYLLKRQTLSAFVPHGGHTQTVALVASHTTY